MPNSVSSCIQMVHAHWFLCVCGLNLLRIERNIFWMASQLGLEEYLRNQQKMAQLVFRIHLTYLIFFSIV